MAIAEIRRWRQLEDENSRPKPLVADLTLDTVILQEVLAKKAWRTCALVLTVTVHFAVGVRRACGLIRLNQASWYYRHHERDDPAVRMRLRELA